MAAHRILFISKFRSFVGGVESHLQLLSRELVARGHEVSLFASEDLRPGDLSFDVASEGVRQKLSTARSVLWNGSARIRLIERIEHFQPDLLHYHSISHQLSPSVLRVKEIPAVMTLHDFKLAAPCYSLYRDAHECHDCVGKQIAWPAVAHRCVKSSVSASCLCAIEDLVHRDRHLRAIDKFIVPSNYSRDVMEKAGIPADAMQVIPWGVEPAARPNGSPTSKRPRVLYAGRLHSSKGINLLVQAWTRHCLGSTGAHLLIAGDGEERAAVEGAAARDSSIEYLGMLDPNSVQALMHNCDLFVAPSRVPETMGLSSLEAMTAGVPVALSGTGALADLVGAGVVQIDVSSEQALAGSIHPLLSPSKLDSCRRALAERDLSMYAASRMVSTIESLYDTVLGCD